MEAKGLRIPDNYKVYGFVMSNSSGEIDVEIAEHIKDKPLSSHYAAWDFCGYVWHEDNKWCCEVWVYNNYITTFVCGTLEEIMTEVSDEFGYK